MSGLPPGWTHATIPELISPSGVFSDGDWVESKDQDPDGEVRLTQLADIGDGRWRDRSSRYMTAAKAAELGCTLLQTGDVLVARMPEPLGRACIFPGDARPSVTVVDVAIVRPGTRAVSTPWLMHALNSPQVRKAVAAHQAGTTRKRISRKNLGTIKVPVPPHDEQLRIVEELERRFSHLDAAVRSLERLSAQLRTARISVLASCTRPSGANLSRVRLGDVAQVRLGRQRSPQNHTGPQMRPYLRAANVGWNGLKLDDVKEMNFTDDEVATYRLAKNDVVLSEASGSAGEVGKAALWDEQLPECCFQNTLIRVRCGDTLLPQFLLHRLTLEALLGTWVSQDGLARGVGIHHLGATRLANWELEVPMLSEQVRLAAEADRRLSLLEAAEKSVQKSLARSDQVRRSLLAAAFSGRLVPQDPNDEPASALLERLRAEREAAPKPARRKKKDPAA